MKKEGTVNTCRDNARMNMEHHMTEIETEPICMKQLDGVERGRLCNEDLFAN